MFVAYYGHDLLCGGDVLQDTLQAEMARRLLSMLPWNC